MHFFCYSAAQRGGAVVARKAHNLEVAGASPAPATKLQKDRSRAGLFVL